MNKQIALFLVATLAICSSASNNDEEYLRFFKRFGMEHSKRIVDALSRTKSKECLEYSSTDSGSSNVCTRLPNLLNILPNSFYAERVGSSLVRVTFRTGANGFELTGLLDDYVGSKYIKGSFVALAIDLMQVNFDIYINPKENTTLIQAIVLPAKKYITSVQWNNCDGLARFFGCPEAEDKFVQGLQARYPVVVQEEINRLLTLNRAKLGFIVDPEHVPTPGPKPTEAPRPTEPPTRRLTDPPVPRGSWM